MTHLTAGVLTQCSGGSGNPPAPGCPPGVDADMDDDGDVDANDFVLFAQWYTGSLTNACLGPGLGGLMSPGGDQSAAQLPASGTVHGLPSDPTIEEMEAWLRAYCEENGIPWP